MSQTRQWRIDDWLRRPAWPWRCHPPGARSDLLHLDVEDLHAAGDLPRRHAEQTGGACLHPAGAFEGRDHSLALAGLGEVLAVAAGSSHCPGARQRDAAARVTGRGSRRHTSRASAAALACLVDTDQLGVDLAAFRHHGGAFEADFSSRTLPGQWLGIGMPRLFRHPLRRPRRTGQSPAHPATLLRLPRQTESGQGAGPCSLPWLAGARLLRLRRIERSGRKRLRGVPQARGLVARPAVLVERLNATALGLRRRWA